MSEAEYINITLGSLLQEDLRDLEDMGFLPDEAASPEPEASGEKEASQTQTSGLSPATRSTALRQSYGVPWFEGLVAGTRLGNMTRSHGIKRTEDGKVKVEWEIFEFNGDDGSTEDADMEDPESASSSTMPAKRKREASHTATTSHGQ